MTWAQIGALLVAAGGLGATIAGLIKVKEWFDDRRKIRQDRDRSATRREYEAEIQGSFVYEIATNHLPHLYDGLRLIAERLDVTLPEPPPIKYLPFEPGKERN